MDIIQSNIQDSLKSFLSRHSYTHIAVIDDKNTHRYCYPSIRKILPKHHVITINAGEEYKNLDTCQFIWQKLTNHQFDRHSLVINLGGGVIGDMGGFCASTYKRGIDFIQIPTTLLAQVDASAGGKLGIDFEGFKNHIGVFKNPKAVLIDSQFLTTLSHRELRSGFAEIIKHCLISDINQWNEIRFLDFEDMPFDSLISHSVAVKKEVTDSDPQEKGLRKILNFGHTIGHAIETYFLLTGDRILHGEAVAAGMICEAYLSYKKQLLSLAELNQIEEFIYPLYGVLNIEKEEFESIIHLTSQDKKNKGNQIQASLLEGIGNCIYDIEISKADIRKSLQYYLGN